MTLDSVAGTRKLAAVSFHGVTMKIAKMSAAGAPAAPGPLASSAAPEVPSHFIARPAGPLADLPARWEAGGSGDLFGEPSFSFAGTARGGPAEELRVFRGPTRRLSQGFDEVRMYAVFSRSRQALELEATVAAMGFRYAGRTENASKANTDFEARTIRINRDCSAASAALSLAYELGNASHSKDFEVGPLRLLTDGNCDLATARRYSELVLRIEAWAVLTRSQVAIAIGHTSLVRNPLFNEIAGSLLLTDIQKVEAIYQEMRSKGTVGGGRVSAFQYYVDQYLAHRREHEVPPQASSHCLS